jgi:DNA polymerase III delta prime subunit
MTNTYDHLDSYAKGLVHAELPERVRSILKPRFIEHPAVKRIREWVDRRIQGPRSVRPPCLLIAADSGAGKTSTLLHLQRCHPDRMAPEGGKTIRTIVRCDIEPYPEIHSMQQILLTCLGAPPIELRTKEQRNDLIGRYLKELETQVVLFDELQHVRHLSARWQAIAMDWIKWISTHARVHVVCAGVQGVERLVQNDLQLSSRFPVTKLPRWSEGRLFATFLQAYERSLPLQRPSHLWDFPMQKALLEESRALHTAAGVTDGVVRIIQEAGVEAVRTGRERITRDLLSAWREPSQLPGHEKRGTAESEVLPTGYSEGNDHQLSLSFQE